MHIALNLTDDEAAYLVEQLHRGARTAGSATVEYRLAASLLTKLAEAEKALAEQPPTEEPGKTFGFIDQGNPW